MPLCHHIWVQSRADEVSTVDGLKTKRYTHACPKCGKVKVTVRADRALPPEVKWQRELEKLILRANADGFGYALALDGSPSMIPIRSDRVRALRWLKDSPFTV